MRAGFEVFTDNGHLQITDQIPAIGFIRKGSVISSVPGAFQVSAEARIPLNDISEICAFSCAAPVSLLYYDAATSEMVLGVDTAAANSVQVDYYVFGLQTKTSNAGLQLFDSYGQLTYDSSWQLFSPVSSVGVGSHSFRSGHKYAVLPVNYYTKVVFSGVRFPSPADAFELIHDRYDDACRVINHTVTVANAKTFAYSRTYQYPPFQPLPNSYYSERDNGASTAYLVIDVTNF
ncbi:hypothetical protein [Idiomarina xiamenensis]|uniref:Uncharacterized protein n=1 Tax=Idiomarina xiamenensis 10-D-4 TaxID=740709 RepID=K2JYR8_9GAMM|nr:hypothetical protein [Idiomarina xiamenensis]EKE79732.1 hypothetical protein A10D4_12769 [Idiomarina xiamenensis 10-D-4]